MGAINFKFKYYLVAADVGYEEAFYVDKNDFEITEDLAINSSVFVSDQGLIVPVSPVYCFDAGNFVFSTYRMTSPRGFIVSKFQWFHFVTLVIPL